MSSIGALIALGVGIVLLVAFVLVLVFGIRALIHHNARQRAKTAQQDELEKMKLKDL